MTESDNTPIDAPDPAKPRSPGPHDSTFSAHTHTPTCPAGGPPVGATVELADPLCLLTDRQRAELQHLSERALGVLHTYGSVRAKILNDDAMARAHERYSDVPGTTDVLTFDMRNKQTKEQSSDQSTHDRALDVDLLLCADEARRQSDVRNHPITHELTLYIVHGSLHCLGFDDCAEDDARAMHAEEDRVLDAIGIGCVYSSSTTDQSGAGA